MLPTQSESWFDNNRLLYKDTLQKIADVYWAADYGNIIWGKEKTYLNVNNLSTQKIELENWRKHLSQDTHWDISVL